MADAPGILKHSNVMSNTVDCQIQLGGNLSHSYFRPIPENLKDNLFGVSLVGLPTFLMYIPEPF